MPLFIDLAHEQGEDGIFDFVVDPVTRDLVLSPGLESPLLVALFSDRRAYADEVADPMERRGWIGNSVAEVPGDNHGSGLWLYEQRRLTPETVTGVRFEAEQALTSWLPALGLARDVTVTVTPEPDKRRVTLRAEITDPDGGVTSWAYVLADATRTGAFYR